jgi:hypothetical protein
MDATTNRRHHLLRRTAALIVLAASLGQSPVASSAPTIGAASPGERALAVWALARYSDAGLELPGVEIDFHRDPSGCRGNSGFYLDLHLDVCVAGQSDAYARRVLVHELAHAWSDARLSLEERDRFLRLRGLDSWDSSDDPWAGRGFEQAAEVMTWALGDGATRILLPDRDDPEGLTTAYRSLTGLVPPTFPGE